MRIKKINILLAVWALFLPFPYFSHGYTAALKKKEAHSSDPVLAVLPNGDQITLSPFRKEEAKFLSDGLNETEKERLGKLLNRDGFVVSEAPREIPELETPILRGYFYGRVARLARTFVIPPASSSKALRFLVEKGNIERVLMDILYDNEVQTEAALLPEEKALHEKLSQLGFKVLSRVGKVWTYLYEPPKIPFVDAKESIMKLAVSPPTSPTYSPEDPVLALRDPSGNIIGGGRFSVTSDYGISPLAFVYSVFIQKNHRGKGAGKALMNALEKHLKRTGVAKIMLHSRTDEAPGFYKKLGYVNRYTVSLGETMRDTPIIDHIFIKNLNPSHGKK
jgi:ribosomal protein S18 acetylase RimI-like enzyme